jgi:DNA replication licensing factor MCM6
VEQAQLLARRQLPAATEMQDDGQEVDETAETERYVFQNTMLVDFVHLRDYDLELAEAVETDMVRFESYLRKAVKAFMLEKHPELDDPETTAATAKNYFVGVYNLPHTLPVRHLRTDQIGRLAAISGTVTRTSDVRPELLVGCFRCNKCGLLAESVAQQYHFTRPLLCRNPRCQNRSPNEFLLEMNDSDGGRSTEFVDWQKLRVQENANEIPPGSMPRSIDVILRNEMVERAKAGDKCVFTGSLVVIPDGSALARAGEAAQARKGGNGRGSGGAADAATGGGGGVRGLSALGVKELTYKTCFVACTVLPADAVSRGHHRQGGASAIASLLFGSDGSGAIVDERDQSADEVMKSFTEEEREEIRQMRKSPQLYSQVNFRQSLQISLVPIHFIWTFITNYYLCVDFSLFRIVTDIDGKFDCAKYVWTHGSQERYIAHASGWCT